MKSLLPFYAVPVLFLISLLPSQARTEAEVRNYLNQTPIVEINEEEISATKALALVQRLAGLDQHKISIINSVPQKTDNARLTLHLKGVPAYDVIKTICKLSGLEFTIKRDQVLIF